MFKKLIILNILILSLNANNYSQLSHAVKELIVDIKVLQNNIDNIHIDFSDDLNKSLKNVNLKVEELELEFNSNINDTNNNISTNKKKIENIYGLINTINKNIETNNKYFSKKVDSLSTTINNNNEMINQNSGHLNIIKIASGERKNIQTDTFDKIDIRKAIMLNREFRKFIQ